MIDRKYTTRPNVKWDELIDIDIFYSQIDSYPYFKTTIVCFSSGYDATGLSEWNRFPSTGQNQAAKNALEKFGFSKYLIPNLFKNSTQTWRDIREAYNASRNITESVGFNSIHF